MSNVKNCIHLEFSVGTFDDMHFTLRQEDGDGGSALQVRARGLFFLHQQPPFLYASTHARTNARVRRSDTNGHFLSPSELQCMYSQNYRAHTPFVGAFADITYCHCAYPWLPAYLGLPLYPPSLTARRQTQLTLSCHHNRE